MNILNLTKDILSINNTSELIFKITENGEIFYNFNNEIIKVNCPDDISDAFFYTVKYIDDAMIEKFIEKIEMLSVLLNL